MSFKMQKPCISVIGMGFVGLVSATCFANRGYKVIATTLDKKVVELVNNGRSPFFEKDLDDLLKRAVDSNNLIASLDNNNAVINSDISFISVGTPMLEDKSIDLSYINNCSIEIGKALSTKAKYHLIVARSTIVPGTTRTLIGKNIEKHSGKKMGLDFGLCMQPEFLKEGNAVYDTFHPNRNVIGELDKKSGEILDNLWTEFYKGEEIPLLRMNLESAEMVKYASNCLLATKISFAMDIANICELIPNLDVVDVMRGVGFDDRISPKFFKCWGWFWRLLFPKGCKCNYRFCKIKKF